MPTTIVQAESEEKIEQIFRLRYEIYVKEMGKHIPGVDHKRLQVRDECDECATHLMALDGDSLIGALRIIWGGVRIPENYRNWYGLNDFQDFPSADFSFTGRLMVLPGRRSTLTASILAREAYRLGCRRGIKFDFIHTTPALVGLFLRLGHRRYRADFLDQDLGPRIPMILALKDMEHLSRCRSPLVRDADVTCVENGATQRFATHRDSMKDLEVFS